ncbi:MAG: prolyl oligopeptidase family serine peptidase [Pseudomonadota bacterium]|nr:prolyl oligopeptidase family serine peptidase [Pseudomonadota bacterium]
MISLLFSKILFIGTYTLTASLAATEYKGLGTESVSKDTIAKFTPKTLTPEVSSLLEKILDIRVPAGDFITSDGKTLFFSWSVTGTVQIWRSNGPKNFPVQMTGGEDPSNLVGLTPDNKYLVLSRDRRGEENPGLYLQSVNGGELVAVQHKAKVQTVYSGVTTDSKYIYYRSNDIAPDSYAIYKYDIIRKSRELLFSQPGIWFVADQKLESQSNSAQLLLGKAKGATWIEYYLFNEADKKLTPLIGQDENQEYEVNFSAKKNQYLVLTNKFSEFRKIYSWDLATKKYQVISPEINWDISEISVDRNHTRATFEINEGGYTRIGAIDLSTLKQLTMPKFKDYDHVRFGTTSANSKFTIIDSEKYNELGTSHVYNWQTKKMEVWVTPSAPELNVANYVKAQLEYYVAQDGTKIPMFVRRPPQCNDAVCPVIVDFHGGPEGQSIPGFNRFAQLFVDRGFIYVEPNVRGSDGYGKTWFHADDGAKRLNVIGDIADCGKYIKKTWAKNGVTPKVGIKGGSYGGYSTLMGMTRFAGVYDAGASGVGMSNLVTFLTNTAPYRRILRVSEYGDLEKDHQALVDLSPMTYLNQIRDPLLVLQGVNDPRVPVGEALQIFESLKTKGIASELILFPDEGHGIAKRANRVLQMGHTLAFFEKHLKGK